MFNLIKFLYKFRRTTINYANRNQINILEVKNIEHIVNSIPTIPEHIDITGEVDKQLEIIAGAEDKLSALRQHYGKKEAKTVL